MRKMAMTYYTSLNTKLRELADSLEDNKNILCTCVYGSKSHFKFLVNFTLFTYLWYNSSSV